MSHGTNVELAWRDLGIEIEKLQAECQELIEQVQRWKVIAACSYCELNHDYLCTKHRPEETEEVRGE